MRRLFCARACGHICNRRKPSRRGVIVYAVTNVSVSNKCFCARGHKCVQWLHLCPPSNETHGAW